MSDRCLKPEELGEFAGRGADDPRRAHVDACPQCQALLRSYADFVDPVDIPFGADLGDADLRLAAALDREIGVAGSGGDVVRPAASFWTPFRVRALAAVAAVVIVAVGLSLFRPGSGMVSPGEPVLRGIGAPAAPFFCQVEMLDGGGFRVSWPGIAEATGYRLVVFGEDLTELAGFEVGMETTFELQMPAGAAFCRVVALRDGDELGRSDPAYFDGC